jgi:hypothetical protein
MNTLFHWLYVQAILIDLDHLNDWLEHIERVYL